MFLYNELIAVFSPGTILTPNSSLLLDTAVKVNAVPKSTTIILSS